jgi:aerobic-type carbon monoxide dehydrogenase small subunit (CoxS/CutS family)
MQFAKDTLMLRVNGSDHEIRADPATPLVYVLRNELGLTGVKLGCGLEQCGACAVLVDGKSALSCNAPVEQFVGGDIRTIETRDDPVLDKGKAAFIDAGAAQCGYCIPGLVIAVTALLKQSGRPTESEIREALQPHLCRCGTHARILTAARKLASEGSPQ